MAAAGTSRWPQDCGTVTRHENGHGEGLSGSGCSMQWRVLAELQPFMPRILLKSLRWCSTGLLVVSTQVGGVPEVLPEDMLVLAEPSPDGLIEVRCCEPLPLSCTALHADAAGRSDAIVFSKRPHGSFCACLAKRGRVGVARLQWARQGKQVAARCCPKWPKRRHAPIYAMLLILLQAVRQALGRVQDVDPWQFHHAVRSMYSWHSIAKRTERAYQRAMQVSLVVGLCASLHCKHCQQMCPALFQPFLSPQHVEGCAHVLPGPVACRNQIGLRCFSTGALLTSALPIVCVVC
jgi:hypothetical protein